MLAWAFCNLTVALLLTKLYSIFFDNDNLITPPMFGDPSCPHCDYAGFSSFFPPPNKMTVFLPRIIQAKRVLRRSFSNGSSTSTSIDIPKGYFAVYVGEEGKRRFVVPVSLLSEPAFQELLQLAEEQFGYDHPMGGLTIPCSEDMFADIASRFGAL
ncbi:hypothetical protein E3N88_08603 [Mikania micrantha]|uniref:Uncharacterized protein n=2 Tax=Mikania micrantha TaxID=192012 RepID=A0A5N6PGR3_9ASTR|nr:hypothetical protein E3N88_08600 [Mikania micrantha]KAD6453895.1 hypothetical protein E3N88_08601 [Mikania micrantha]KAD6453897.1 hypothetical protein E3N88_08603 [Mikania micrantha]